MLSTAQNERITRVGPGTPMGTLMRRYWQPVAGEAELVDAPTKRVRILGESLTLFKDKSGRYGLIAQRVRTAEWIWPRVIRTKTG